MSILQDKKVLIIITAGIAAYKTAYLVRLLIKKGAVVQVVITKAAKEFITPLTLSTLSKNTVYSDFQDSEGKWISHVDLALESDYIIVAPATSNTISKMASAKCDNLALAVYLSAKCPIYFAPAMDLDMYQNPSNKKNIEILQNNGNILIPATKGELASGLEGEGRMEEPENILFFIENHIKQKLSLFNKKVLITAGPTYEAIDPVRFIGNHSSGKMGFELAKQAEKLGAEVVLISGPTAEKISNSSSINLINITSASEMHDEVFKYYKNSDIAIMCAAVADYKPKEYIDKKIKKSEDNFILELVKNKDILKAMGESKKKQFLVGFALETDNELENAKKKLSNKNLDAIVLNSLKDEGAGFKHDTNKTKFIDKENNIHEISLKTKTDVAKDIFSLIEKKLK